jgi:hypothetical protein
MAEVGARLVDVEAPAHVCRVVGDRNAVRVFTNDAEPDGRTNEE